jgi:hypothetical protein
VKVEQIPVVHLVDVIAGQDYDKLWFCLVEERKILKHGVCRAQIPLAARRAEAEKEFVSILMNESLRNQSPCVRVQGFTSILSEDGDAPETGVETVGKRKVDQTVNAAKRDKRFGSLLRERIQTLPTPSCENEREGVRRDSRIRRHKFLN